MSLSDEIKTLEARLLDPGPRADVRFLDQILDDGFVEIGQSGRFYDKQGIIRALEAAPGFPGPRTIVDFDAREIGPDLILAVYRIVETRTARSSIWQRTGPGWRLIFHQGTPSS